MSKRKTVQPGVREREDNVDGRLMVTTDEERMLPGGDLLCGHVLAKCLGGPYGVINYNKSLFTNYMEAAKREKRKHKYRHRTIAYKSSMQYQHGICTIVKNNDISLNH